MRTSLSPSWCLCRRTEAAARERTERGLTGVSEHRGQSELEQGLSELLEHDFSQPALLRLALTHSSLGYEEQMAREAESSATTAKDNEQLEFIGDAVLGLIVAETLYRRYPHLREGDLTRLRASLVSRKHLAERAAELRLGDYLRLGKGEETTGGRKKPALLSDAMEAVVAALYLDGGMGAATKFVLARIVEPALPALAEAMGGGGAI